MIFSHQKNFQNPSNVQTSSTQSSYWQKDREVVSSNLGRDRPSSYNRHFNVKVVDPPDETLKTEAPFQRQALA